jgi:hypothetical protein
MGCIKIRKRISPITIIKEGSSCQKKEKIKRSR